MPYPDGFNHEEKLKLAMLWGKHENYDRVRWEFAKFYEINRKPSLIPPRRVIKRIINKWLETGTLHPKRKARAITVRTPETIQRVKDQVTANNSKSISAIACELDMCYSTVWKILRVDLHWYPYKPKRVNKLTDDQKIARVEFCERFLQQPDGFSDIVVWSDEKIFRLVTRPNSQNERYWAPKGEDPLVEEECRVQGGESVMAWAMIVDGVVSVYWHPPGTRVDQHVYLRMLQEFMLPKIADRERRDEFVFQQDGARCHTTQGVRQWLAEQFGVVISGPLLAEWPWPANSPDLTGCDYWLWGHILQEIRRVKPESLEELKDIVDTFVDSLDPEEVRKATADIYPRTRLCIDNGGGHFEAELKKYKRRSDVEE